MTDERLDRVLFALKERIPTKLSKEVDLAKRRGSMAKEKIHVDVYRGSDYQIAYYFRRSNKKHVILLKDKSLVPQRGQGNTPHHMSDMPSKNQEMPSDNNGATQIDLTQTDVEPGVTRASPGAATHAIRVKEEEQEQDFSQLPISISDADEDDEKPDLELKPQLQVRYHSYSIFNRSLIVIIEPYPALSTTQLASIAPNNPMSAEIRQLSATPTASATPAPIMRRGRDLFRSATTPLDYGYAEDDEEGAVRLREASAKLAADMDSEDSDYLPTLDERRTTRSARGV